jgi:hypothetical protein
MQLDEAPPVGVDDAASGRTHVYAAGILEARLPPGTYDITAYKGPEYRVESARAEIRPGQTSDVAIRLSRWIDLPAAGWFSADGHLHISRPGPELDPVIVDWMRAEDIHVANLLQSGLFDGRIESAPQHGFGPDVVYQDGDTIIASGQENPRTWVLGHVIVLGATTVLDAPERYLAYDAIWSRSRAQGALGGYAHFHAPGLLLDAPDGFVDFLEVLQFDVANYASLYDLWSLGFRVSPYAGTDYPCPPSGAPGSQRLYANVQGALSYPSWLDAVRHGRTFVTNGPLLELTVDGTGIGGEVRVAGPGRVRVQARVRFDPARDDVRALEVVRDREVVEVGGAVRAGEIAVDTMVDVRATGWMAARASGVKMPTSSATARPRDSLAHTGAIRIHVEGSGLIDAQDDARDVADALLGDLDELEGRFDERGIDATCGLPEAWTGASCEVLRAGQDHVLRRIASARAFYRGLVARRAQRRLRD